MDVYIVMQYNMCDDYYYGYNEKLLSVCGSFEEAKVMVDTLLLEYGYYGTNYDKDKHRPFLEISQTQIGFTTEREVLYTSMEFVDSDISSVDCNGDDTSNQNKNDGLSTPVYSDDDYLTDDTKLVQATTDVEILTDKIKTLEANQDKLFAKQDKLRTKQDKLFHYFNASQIGISADINALNQIFPKCRRNDFEIETMAELKVFLDNINTRNDLVSSDEKTSWRKLSPRERAGIKKRYADMIILHPRLISSIQLLKEQWLQASVNYWTKQV